MIALPRSPTLGSHFQKIPFPSSVRELKSRLHIILAFFFVLFFIFSWSIYLPHRSRGIYFRNSHPKDLVAIYNETLGVSIFTAHISAGKLLTDGFVFSSKRYMRSPYLIEKIVPPNCKVPATLQT